MATAAQIDANQLNAQSSTGPTSEEGKQASSQNRTTHGLCHNHTCFYLLAGEDPQKYSELYTSLKEEHQPQTETERILVRHLAQHEWLRTRGSSGSICATKPPTNAPSIKPSKSSKL